MCDNIYTIYDEFSECQNELCKNKGCMAEQMMKATNTSESDYTPWISKIFLTHLAKEVLTEKELFLEYLIDLHSVDYIYELKDYPNLYFSDYITMKIVHQVYPVLLQDSHILNALKETPDISDVKSKNRQSIFQGLNLILKYKQSKIQLCICLPGQSPEIRTKRSKNCFLIYIDTDCSIQAIVKNHIIPKLQSIEELS